MISVRDDYSRLRIQIIFIVLGVYGASLLFFFGFNLLAFPEKLYLIPYRARWTFINTFIQFVDTLIPVQCAAILSLCTFIPPPTPSIGRENNDGSSAKLISTSLAVFIALGVIFVVANEGLVPSLRGKLSGWRYQTEVARNYLHMAEDAKRSGKLKQGEAYLIYYLTIDPGSRHADSELREIRKQMGSQTDQSDGVETDRSYRLSELTPGEFMRKAKDSEDEEDYITAYYYAKLAVAGSRPGTRDHIELQEHATRIWDKLSSLTDNREDLESRWRFEVKTVAFNDLSSQDVTAIPRAYYTFRMLLDSDPTDAEARRYLEETRKKLRKIAFFTDEVAEIGIMPGVTDVFFVNSAADDPYTELVSFGKIIATGNGTYVQDIEVIRFEKGGGLECHFTASYGKIMTDKEGRLSVFLRGAHPEFPAGGMLPLVVVGPEDFACPEIVPIQINPAQTVPLSGGEWRFSELGLRRLWRNLDTLTALGYREEPLQIEILFKIGSLFGFLILSIASLALGWKFRSPDGLPPILTLAILPVFPFACYFIAEVYLYLHRLLIGTALLAWGFGIAAAALLAIEIILLFAATVLLAGTTKVRGESAA